MKLSLAVRGDHRDDCPFPSHPTRGGDTAKDSRTGEAVKALKHDNVGVARMNGNSLHCRPASRHDSHNIIIPVHNVQPGTVS